MTIYYSKTTKGFYDSEIHGKNIPEDKVEISKEAHAKLLEGQSFGKVIEGDKKGVPVLRDPPELSGTETATVHNARILAEIRHIEQNFQPRAMRDLILYNDNAKLLELDKQIADLRSQLK
jgi:hypothetical protein